ncbi:CII family transcriptional regulator [Herbaspirillum seropedicae]|uniref:CII family transcriptional regulator n=1 Tax=Herbaspirillum seropedicae TaxID=964 RepID=UPI003FCE12CC
MTTADPSSPEDPEITRKAAALIEGEVLRRLAEVKQSRAAECMGVHASTVSRWVAEELPKAALFLAAIGCQVAPADAMMFSPDKIAVLEDIAADYFAAKRAARRGKA